MSDHDIPFDMVVVGATGDLGRRKLLPALYDLHKHGEISPRGRILAVSRREGTRESFLAGAGEKARRHVEADELTPEDWQSFTERLDFVTLTATDPSTYGRLSEILADGRDRERIFYLATSPAFYGDISHAIADAGLITERSRIVLEKPIGTDLESARAINASVGEAFREHQIFRIDHYLGKETVQNLMAVRFGNVLFEPMWSCERVDHVQITVAETLGVEGRGGYYDQSGALHDMLQNHLLQLLCLTAMEPPARLDQDSIREEKIKVLRALHPLTPEDVAKKTVRGQYRAGAVDRQPVDGYLEEPDVAAGSTTETFVALKAEIENWRWAGVPFYLRTGKRLPERVSEIVVAFKPIPHSIFPAEAGTIHTNKLVMRLQPDEGVKQWIMIKDPGPGGMQVRHVPLDMSFADAFDHRHPEAYERLLLDVIRGDQTLFMRRDEVEAAWAWIDPIRQAWETARIAPNAYTAGTWGPSAAIALIERDGRTWHEETL